MLYYSLVLGVTFGIASLALFFSLRKPGGFKELRRAFEALEEEFEDQRDHVRSAMGRISRLKRSMMNGEVAPEPGSEPEPEAPALQATFPGLTPRQAAAQAKILARRKGGSVQ